MCPVSYAQHTLYTVLQDTSFFPPHQQFFFFFDMCMSYGWRESFNTVNRQIRDVITTGIDMCGRRMRKGGGGDGPYIRRGAD